MWLHNQRNSCYIDSLLVAIFFHKQPWILRFCLGCRPTTRFMKLAQRELQGIMSGDINSACVLRDLLDLYVKHHHLENRDMKYEQLEPFDVLRLFIHIFKPSHDVIVSTVVIGTNMVQNRQLSRSDLKVVSQGQSRHDFEFVSIDSAALQARDSISATDYILHNVEDEMVEGWEEGFSRRIVQTRILDAPGLFVHVNRLNASGSKLDCKVIFDHELRLPMGHVPLRLLSVIIHHGSPYGGHYTSMLKCDKEWKIYDDMVDALSHACNETELMTWNGCLVSRCSTDAFYGV
jgi:Ubiquitin carboxyl-terminal hydrolase